MLNSNHININTNNNKTNINVGPGVYLAIVNNDFRSFFIFHPLLFTHFRGTQEADILGPYILTQLEGICKKI